MPELNINFNETNNDCFKPLFKNQDRYLVLKGGSGSGKSHFVAQKIIYRCLTEVIKHKFLILRKVSSGNKISTFQVIKVYLDKWDIPYESVQNEIRFLGHLLLFKGLDDDKKIKSIEGVTGIWMEEAAEFTVQDFNQLDLRLRGEFGTYKQLILSFNPEGGKNSWIYKNFYEREHRETFLHQSTWRDNKFIDEGYENRVTDTLDETHIAIYDKGEWAEMAHAVFKNYKVLDLDVPDILMRADRFYCGVDFGFVDPCTCMLIAEIDQEIYILKEVYVTRVVTREFIDIIKTDVPVPGTAIAELSQMRFYCENAEADRLREMQLARLRVMKIDKSRIKKGLDLLKSRMIYINATCVWAAKEFSSYSYQKDSQGTVIDIPNDRDNHTIDATRYAVFSNSRSTMQLF